MALPRRDPADPGGWIAAGACRGRTAEMIEPERKTSETIPLILASKAICRSCLVYDECRAWALTNPDPADGMIAAGMTRDERIAARRRRVSV